MWLIVAKALDNTVDELLKEFMDMGKENLPPAQIAKAQELAAEIWEKINK